MLSFYYSVNAVDSTSTQSQTLYSTSSSSTYGGVPYHVDYFTSFITQTATSTFTGTDTTTSSVYNNWGTYTQTCDFGATSSSETASGLSVIGVTSTQTSGTTVHNTDGTHTITEKSVTIFQNGYTDLLSTAACGFTYYTVVSSSTSYDYGSYTSYEGYTVTHDIYHTHTVSEYTRIISVSSSVSSTHTDRCDFGDPITQSSTYSEVVGGYSRYTSETTSHGYYGYHTVTSLLDVATSTTTVTTDTDSLIDINSFLSSSVVYQATTGTSQSYGTTQRSSVLYQIGSSQTASQYTYLADVAQSTTSYITVNFLYGSYTLAVTGGGSVGYSSAIIYNTDSRTSQESSTYLESDYTVSNGNLSKSTHIDLASRTDAYYYTSYIEYDYFAFVSDGRISYSGSTLNGGGAGPITATFTTRTDSFFTDTLQASSTTSHSESSTVTSYSAIPYATRTTANGVFTTTYVAGTMLGTKKTTTTASFTYNDISTVSAAFYNQILTTALGSTFTISRSIDFIRRWSRFDGEILCVPTMTYAGTQRFSDAVLYTVSFDDSRFTTTTTESGYTANATETFQSYKAITSYASHYRSFATGIGGVTVNPDASSIYSKIEGPLLHNPEQGNSTNQIYHIKQYARAESSSTQGFSLAPGAFDFTYTGTTYADNEANYTTYYVPLEDRKIHPRITITPSETTGALQVFAFATSNTILSV